MNTITFLNFIQENSIRIPLIQRDYVQGLALNDKTREKRNEFVKKLLDAILPNGEPYTLDFIYGAPESFEDTTQNDNAPFLPLDGQQRLTTLYLLHWILAVKTNIEGCNNNVLALLKKFSYKTRITSDKFCIRLLKSEFEADSLCEQIRKKPWYVSLETDPTVIAMMSMIEQIEETIKEEPYKSNMEDLAVNLFDTEKHRITFSILNMARYKLTDGLYVKMNARGKELTSFENWKADFINLISANESQKDRFTNSIEHKWNDVFWKDVYKEYAHTLSQTIGENDKKKIKYPRIDEHFMNFFTNFSRMLFFVETASDDPKVEDFNGKIWSTIEILYGNNNYLLEKLFSALDALVKIDEKKGIESFFSELFHTNPSTGWNENYKGVKLFDCNNVNLFRSCFENDSFGWQHVMLYAILKYCVKHNVFEVTDNLRKYSRICRNYLYQHNYFDSGNVRIAPQIRVTDMKTYDKVFDYLCLEKNPVDSLKKDFSGKDANYLGIERDKKCYYECKNTEILKLAWKIEDMSYCYGYIRAFDDVLKQCVDEKISCESIWNAIYSFRCANVIQKVQLFIAFNYEGMTIGNDCAYGKRVFIGSEFGGVPRWDVHFRRNENGIRKWINDYIYEYSRTPDISAIIESKKAEIINNPQTMRDYMLKYEHILAAQVHWKDDDINKAPFYFAMPNPWKDMDAITIHSFSSRPLGNSYQTCPFANAVAHNMANYDGNHMGYAGQGSHKSGIMFHNGDWTNVYFSMYFRKHNWYVSKESGEYLSDKLKRRLEPVNIEEELGEYLLSPVQGKDIIENATEFIDDVVIEFKSRAIF